MTTPPPVLPPRPAGPGSSVRRALDSELSELFAISPQALMLFDKTGRIWQSNAPLLGLAGRVSHLGELGEALVALLGWPGELPGVGLTREREGWIEAPKTSACVPASECAPPAQPCPRAGWPRLRI
ncbi:hypothetical protein [Ideonella paludis]|uniref:hypothetical protein n=1 Tax=Ideonella paludis TaxID=1233411 RepID=UPI003639F7D4